MNLLEKLKQNQPTLIKLLKGSLDIAGEVTGAGPLGKAAAQGAFYRFTPEGREIMDKVRKGEMTQADAEKIVGKTLGTGEVVRGAATMAALPLAYAKVTGFSGKTLRLLRNKPRPEEPLLAHDFLKHRDKLGRFSGRKKPVREYNILDD